MRTKLNRRSVLRAGALSILIVGVTGIGLFGCTPSGSRATAVYLLVDTSGTYTKELAKAQGIVNYLLGTLNSGDSLGVARIDSGSFTEKNIINKVTFDSRPSFANDQKRAFKRAIDEYVASVTKGSDHTDITGGVLQATQYLNETGAKKKYILIFSDLEEDLKEGQIRDFPLELMGTQVIAVNVTKLRTDNIDPRDYLNRVEQWKKRVIDGGGEWRVVNDLDNLDKLLSG
ncbi:MAG: VWA domain-containing protein [Gammaproteobacteria bacterium]|nr:VWA domain-containing protein [Gammaproteobacteria bacterium]